MNDNNKPQPLFNRNRRFIVFLLGQAVLAALLVYSIHADAGQYVQLMIAAGAVGFGWVALGGIAMLDKVRDIVAAWRGDDEEQE